MLSDFGMPSAQLETLLLCVEKNDDGIVSKQDVIDGYKEYAAQAELLQ